MVRVGGRQAVFSSADGISAGAFSSAARSIGQAARLVLCPMITACSGSRLLTQEYRWVLTAYLTGAPLVAWATAHNSPWAYGSVLPVSIRITPSAVTIAPAFSTHRPPFGGTQANTPSVTGCKVGLSCPYI